MAEVAALSAATGAILSLGVTELLARVDAFERISARVEARMLRRKLVAGAERLLETSAR